jgi:ADP-dependent NAD(P)H-hydrate dehydratase / NAD(P)H-hydrate epimerase
LKCSTADLQSDRYSAISELSQKFSDAASTTIVLKGAGTLVKTGDEVCLCPYGNPGMGSGGMGDVLTGVIAGLWAQGLSRAQAVRLGVCAHSKAADNLVQQFGERGLLATDLIPEVRSILNGKSVDGTRIDG